MRYFKIIHANSIFLILIALTLSLLAGGQYFGASKDVEQYKLFFDNLNDEYAGRFEILFVYFSRFIRLISEDFSFYLFTLTIAGISLKIYVLSRFRFFYLSLLWYLLVLFPLHELTQYRASISYGILYLVFYLLSVKQKIIHSYLFFTASVFFHYSAIAFLPFVLFWGRLSRLKTFSFIYASIAILFLALAKGYIFSIVGEINSTVLSNDSGDLNIFSSRNLILFSLVIFGFLDFKSIPNEIKPFFYISIYGFVLWSLFYDLPVFAHRLFEATFMSYFIWLTSLTGIYRVFSRILMSTLALYLVYKMSYGSPLFT